MVLIVDQDVSTITLGDIVKAAGAEDAKFIDLVDN